MLLCALVALAGVAGLLLPRALAGHQAVAGTPVAPPPGFQDAPIALPAGSRACVDSVALSPRVGELRLSAERGRGPLAVGVQAEGYSAGAKVEASAGIRVRLPRPPREELATVCVRNAGTATTTLLGVRSGDAESRSTLKVDGRPRKQDLVVLLFEPRATSTLSRLGAMIERMQLFKPGWAGAWLFWILFVLVVVGVPAGTVAALWSSLREVPE